jgi:hypothetical protein
VQRQVNHASDRGADWLRGQQRPDGTFSGAHQIGLTALPALTLLECGARPDDPVIRKAARFVREGAPRLAGAFETYELSLAVLFLDRLADPGDRALVRSLALRLVAGQRPDGGWSYRCPRLGEKEQTKLLATLDAGRPRLDRARPGSEGGLPDRAANQARPAAGSDNSNTQFAVLALWAASRHGLPLEAPLGAVARRFRASQSADGSWGYHGMAGSPAMTGVGLLGLAVGHGLAAEDPARKPVRDADIDRGLSALARHVGERSGGDYNLYFLWTLERVCVLYRLRELEGKDWYRPGVDFLLPRQRPDGSWRVGGYPGSSALSDTGLALLFLRRANLAADLTHKLGSFLRVGGAAR